MQEKVPKKIGGNGWESNPPRPATRPATGFEDRGAHRDSTTPVVRNYIARLYRSLKRIHISDNRFTGIPRDPDNTIIVNPRK